jgi:hypothetical protein
MISLAMNCITKIPPFACMPANIPEGKCPAQDYLCPEELIRPPATAFRLYHPGQVIIAPDNINYVKVAVQRFHTNGSDIFTEWQEGLYRPDCHD